MEDGEHRSVPNRPWHAYLQAVAKNRSLKWHLRPGDRINDAQMPGALPYGSRAIAGFEQSEHDSRRHDQHERCHQIRSNCAHGMSHTTEVQRNAHSRSDRYPRQNAEPVNKRGNEAAPRVPGHDPMLLTHHARSVADLTRDWEPIRSTRDDVDRHAGLMPQKLSAGLLLYRRVLQDDKVVLEVLLAHMGGPFWARKDDGAWSIPKGEHEPGEDPFLAAKREFEEELGSAPPLVVYRNLGSVSQPGGKVVTAWAAEADFDAADIVSNTFELEWPRESGRMRSFPEIDRAGWFTAEVARVKLVRGQQQLIDRLLQMLADDPM